MLAWILDRVEKSKTPWAIVVTIVILAAAIFFVRWVFSDEASDHELP
jgi:F0F1-type ATP synthase assembly protein I